MKQIRYLFILRKEKRNIGGQHKTCFLHVTFNFQHLKSIQISLESLKFTEFTVKVTREFLDMVFLYSALFVGVHVIFKIYEIYAVISEVFHVCSKKTFF